MSRAVCSSASAAAVGSTIASYGDDATAATFNTSLRPHSSDKAHHALSLFEALRASVDVAASHQVSSTLPSRSTRVGNRHRDLYTDVSLEDIRRSTYTVQEISQLSREELQRKLLTAGCIMKALHGRNKDLQAKVEETQKAEQSRGTRQPSGVPLDEHKAMLRAQHNKVAALRRSVDQLHAALQSATAKHTEAANALQRTSAQLQDVQASAARHTPVAHSHKVMSPHLEDIAFHSVRLDERPSHGEADGSYRAMLQSKLADLDGLRLRLAERIDTLGLQAPDEETVTSRVRQKEVKPRVSTRDAATSSMAVETEELATMGDPPPTLDASRLKLLETQLAEATERCAQMMDVHLAAAIEGAITHSIAKPHGASTCRTSNMKLLNEEVKKLFAVMKQQLLCQERRHEVERSRLNECIYLLERHEMARVV